MLYELLAFRGEISFVFIKVDFFFLFLGYVKNIMIYRLEFVTVF